MQQAVRHIMPRGIALVLGLAAAQPWVRTPKGRPPPASALAAALVRDRQRAMGERRRRLATVVFADIVGFSAIANNLSREKRKNRRLSVSSPMHSSSPSRGRSSAEGGTVMKYVGDS